VSALLDALVLFPRDTLAHSGRHTHTHTRENANPYLNADRINMIERLEMHRCTHTLAEKLQIMRKADV